MKTLKQKTIDGSEAYISQRKRIFNIIDNILFNIKSEDKCLTDLRADELDFVEILMEIEKEFNTVLDERDIEIYDFEKVKDLISWIQDQL